LTKEWRSDPWNWADEATVVALWVGLTNDGYGIRILYPLICIKLLAYMKGLSMSMATFIFLLVQTAQDTESFMIILFVFVLMGSGMLLLTNQDDEERGISDIGHAIWKMVLLTLGDYDDSSYDSAFKGVVFLVFIFLMVIVMMNILIAIVSDSYDDAMARSMKMFLRARAGLVEEYLRLKISVLKMCKGLGMSYEDEKQKRDHMENNVRERLRVELQDEALLHGKRPGRIIDLTKRVEGVVNESVVRSRANLDEVKSSLETQIRNEVGKLRHEVEQMAVEINNLKANVPKNS
jgi:hypothetical protein